MDRQRIKFVVLGIAVLGTMAAMLLVGVQTSGMYYRTVSEFSADPAVDGDLRINGKVTPGTIERLAGGTRVNFLMEEGGASLPVSYEGVIPDTFVDEADVVVQGTLRDDGVFEATLLLAKCPSKYEAAEDAGGATASYPTTD